MPYIHYLAYTSCFDTKMVNSTASQNFLLKIDDPIESDMCRRDLEIVGLRGWVYHGRLVDVIDYEIGLQFT